MAVSSTADGSVVIGVDMNISDAEKSVAKLKKKIEQIETQIKKVSINREEAKKKGILSQTELDAEKAKLRELEQSLKEMKGVVRDKSYSQSIRDETKAQISNAEEKVKAQKERVRMLQTEYNKVWNSVDRYDQKLKELNSDLELQKTAAGSLEMEIAQTEAKFKEMAEAAGVADQHIIDLNKELAELKSRQEELEYAGIGLGYKEYDQNAAREASIIEELKNYKKALAETSDAQKKINQNIVETDRAADAQSRMNAYLEKSGSIYQKIQGMIGKTTEMSGVLQDIASATTGKMSQMLQTAGTALGGFGAKLTGAAVAAGPYIAIILAAVSALKKLSEVLMKFGQEATSGIISYMKTVADLSVSAAHGFVEMLKSIGKFGASSIKLLSDLGKKVVGLTNRFNVFAKLSDSLSGKFKRIGSTIKSALVFSVIYKGLSIVREQMGAYLSVNTQFMTALRRLQGVLLTAFQPIYEVVVPALTTLINILSRAAATVTQFFASLFGTTAKQAQVNAKDLYEQANATTAAGDAAEEAAKQLAGFDEINKLEGSKKAGGGGAVSVDTGPLFDYEYDETPFDSWGEAFSAFLDKLLGGIPKLRDAFKNFADWLNDWSKKVYDMFIFPGVLEKVKRLGRELADALNDLVNWIDWYQLGQALGAGLNLALNFLTSFLYEFDWMNLGRKLAEFVNGLVSEIDWYEFGRLLWAGFKIGLETFAGFITGLDMPQLAEAASNIILGFFHEMENTIKRIPWFNIGRQIAVFLNNIQWYEIITSIADAIHAGIIALYKLVLGFINRLEWNEIAEQIYTAINKSIGNEALFQKLGEVLSSLFIHVFDFCRDVVKGIEWEQIGRDIAAFILGFDWVGALGSLADLIAEGINAAIKFLRGLLDKIMPEIKGIAKGIADRLKKAVKSVHWDELGQVIGDAIKTALSFVAGLLDPELFYEIGKAIGEFLINLDWPGIVGGLAEVLANGIKAAVAAVKGFLEVVNPNLKEIAEDIAQKINEFVETVDWEELGQTIHDGIEAALDFLITILDNLDWDEIGGAIVDFLTGLDWGSLLEKWGTVVGKAIGGALKGIDLGDVLSFGGDIVSGMIQGMLNKWDESGGILGWIKRTLFSPFLDGFKSLFGIHSPSTVMAEQGENLISGLLKGISDTWHSIIDFFTEKLEPLKKLLSDAWDNIKATASTKWGEIKTTLGNKWSEIKTNAQTKFDEIRKKVFDAWNNIKSDAPGKWEEIKTTLSTAWEKIRTKAEGKFGEIKDKIINKMEEIKDKDWYKTGKSVVDSILNGLESIWNSLTSWASRVKSTIEDALSGSRGGGFGTTRSASFGGGYRMAAYSMPDIGNFEIPALAKGAVIPPNREFLAVLGDQRSGNNLEGPESSFEAAVARGIRAAGGLGGNRPITVILQVDRRELGRVVYEVNNEETQRVGVRMTEGRA